MQRTRAAPPSSLEAVLERITYANQETGYTVARVATGRSSDLLTVVGPLPARNRWAERHIRRSRPTVGVKVIGSLPAKLWVQFGY